MNILKFENELEAKLESMSDSELEVAFEKAGIYTMEHREWETKLFKFITNFDNGTRIFNAGSLGLTITLSIIFYFIFYHGSEVKSLSPRFVSLLVVHNVFPIFWIFGTIYQHRALEEFRNHE